MKNVLSYYYNLIPTTIHQINKKYRCYIGSQEYILIQYGDSLEKLNDYYNLSVYLLNMQIPCHEIILNSNNSALTYINNQPYMLLKIYSSDTKVSFHDVAFFSNIFVDYTKYKNLICDNWSKMWSKKIDYFEYQISHIGKKYPIIRDSFNYFIGMAENSISFLQELGNYADNFIICHKRIKFNEEKKDLYNPLNFIFDSKVRDIAEYMKNKFFNSQYNKYEFINDISLCNFNEKQFILLYGRLLFPTYYFDEYENIILGNTEEKSLNKILKKTNEYILFLKDVWLEINKYYKLPEIEWIIKM